MKLTDFYPSQRIIMSSSFSCFEEREIRRISRGKPYSDIVATIEKMSGLDSANSDLKQKGHFRYSPNGDCSGFEFIVSREIMSTGKHLSLQLSR